jgi:predicted MFS family arabinose efflux permease
MVLAAAFSERSALVIFLLLNGAYFVIGTLFVHIARKRLGDRFCLLVMAAIMATVAIVMVYKMENVYFAVGPYIGVIIAMILESSPHSPQEPYSMIAIGFLINFVVYYFLLKIVFAKWSLG